MDYYRVTEDNDCEGECWNFFVPLTAEQVERLRAALADRKDFSMQVRTYSEAEVQAFMGQEGCTSYLPEYNRCAPLTVEIPEDLDAFDELFYKGGAFQVVQSNGC